MAFDTLEKWFKRGTVVLIISCFLLNVNSAEKWSWGRDDFSTVPNTFPNSRLPRLPPESLQESKNAGVSRSAFDSEISGRPCSLSSSVGCLEQNGKTISSTFPGRFTATFKGSVVGIPQSTPVTVIQHHHIHNHHNEGVSNVGARQNSALSQSQLGQIFLPPVRPARVPQLPLGQIAPGPIGIPSQHTLDHQNFETIGEHLSPLGELPSLMTTPTGLYQEACLCVHTTLCGARDVVPRAPSLLAPPLIDPRSRLTDVLSNATVFEGAKSQRKEEKTPNNKVTTAEGNLHVKREAVGEASDVGKAGNHLLGGYAPGITGCGVEHVCCRDPSLDALEKGFTCGQRQARGILGRSNFPSLAKGNAEFGEHPWQAAVLKEEGGEGVYVCGAALVTDRHLLTAAHCVTSLHPSALKIRLGEWDVTSQKEFLNHLELSVAEVRSHPQYYAGNLNNDIALITLQHTIDFNNNPHISPICLPDILDNFLGQRCYSTGWGKDAFGDSGRYQPILKEVEVPVVSHQHCESALKRTRLGHGFTLHEGMMCAGGEEAVDTCTGDGGGPLVCLGPDGSARLAGLVSWGIGCGTNGIPGVYVDVSYYMDWILAYLRI
ncbi:CLIP domain-containing serine protease [Halocaridina rubra]|uniref:CLIP domain-containing serine protease n=1 Tax=Halocaridina rubra TaxID=373956 RepID=A0AAN8ZUW5_HALRR